MVRNSSPSVQRFEHELDVEGRRETALDLLEDLCREAASLERRVIDGRSLAQRAVTHSVGRDLRDLAFAIAERAKRIGNRAVDDLEVAAACELLELHESKVGLDAGRVAIHDEADRAGGRDDGRLGVAEAELLTKLDGAIPCAACGEHDLTIRAALAVERDGRDRDLLVASRVTIGCATVIADDAQHVGAVRLITREGAELGGHFGARRVGDTGHECRDRTAEGAAFGGVVGNAGAHEIAADVRKAQAQGAIAVREFRDLTRGELRHQHRDLEHDGPQTAGMLEGERVEAHVFAAEEREVQGREVAGRVVEEHVFRARI